MAKVSFLVVQSSQPALRPVGIAERNNFKTRNLQRLLYQSAVHVRNVRSSAIHVGATNALTLSRIILKHLGENLNASQLLTFLNQLMSHSQGDLPEGPGQGLPSFSNHLVLIIAVAMCTFVKMMSCGQNFT